MFFVVEICCALRKFSLKKTQNVVLFYKQETTILITKKHNSVVLWLKYEAPLLSKINKTNQIE